MLARAANSGGGGKVRPSCMRASIVAASATSLTLVLPPLTVNDKPTTLAACTCPYWYATPAVWVLSTRGLIDRHYGVRALDRYRSPTKTQPGSSRHIAAHGSTRHPKARRRR